MSGHSISSIPERSILTVAALFSEKPRACPLCGHANASPFERVTHRGVLLTYVICERCGLVYQSPRIPEKELPAFYAAQYRVLYLGQAAPRAQETDI